MNAVLGDLLMIIGVAAVGYAAGRSRSRHESDLDHERAILSNLCCGESVSITRTTRFGVENLTIMREDEDDDDDGDDSTAIDPDSPFDLRHPVPSCENN